MGSEVSSGESSYVIRAPRLRGERLILDYPSHTGTENLLMAACLADGVTTIENASVEPEVLDLADFLCAMGARITGGPARAPSRSRVRHACMERPIASCPIAWKRALSPWPPSSRGDGW